ncbi:hypothetical protein EXW44_20580 [Bacillus mycoides]|nr:hypothetical protein EXW44_20580 [Bacillus mycoides]QWI99489.1 DUF1007 family protein [Bacillus mycoides]HDR7564056.1 DUF1007 family protein [Bacillus mycoides]
MQQSFLTYSMQNKKLKILTHFFLFVKKAKAKARLTLTFCHPTYFISLYYLSSFTSSNSASTTLSFFAPASCAPCAPSACPAAA